MSTTCLLHLLKDFFKLCIHVRHTRTMQELLNQSCPVKVKVTFQGQISNGNILCLLYNSKILKRFFHEFLFNYKAWSDNVKRNHNRTFSFGIIIRTCLPASVAQLDAPSDWRPGGRGFNPRRDRQHSFVEIDREIFSTVILSLPLIQEGQLSVSGERMCTILVNRLED